MPRPSKSVKVKLGVTLHAAQKEIDSCGVRFRVVEAGVRFGKTKESFKYVLDGAIKRPGSKNWIIFPYAKQGRSVAWGPLNLFIPAPIKKGRPNKTHMDIPLINGSEIGIRGSDNEDSLLGESLYRVVLDEASRQKSTVWEEIIRQRLIDQRGEALFISTPYGKNWFHKLYELGKSGLDPEWKSFHFTTYDNPHISREELEKLRTTMTPRLWKREILAEALEDEGLIYGEYGRKNDFEHATEYKGHEFDTQCGRGMDWGYGENGDPAACIWAHLSGNDVLISEEHVQENWSVPKHAEVIKEKSSGRRIIDGLTVLDQSAFKAEGTSETSIGKLFCQNGVQCLPASRDKEAGITLVKALLEAQPWQSRLLISDKCPQVKNALLSWEYGQHEPDCLAGLRYIITAMHKRGLLKLNNVYLNSSEAEARPFNPLSLYDQRRLREQQEEVGSWDFEAGCFD